MIYSKLSSQTTAAGGDAFCEQSDVIEQCLLGSLLIRTVKLHNTLAD